MNKEKARRIFEQYNPASDVVRCPRGRAFIRKQLDLYAKAAVNLYGVISREEFVSIFNEQNTEKTNSKEIYILLLPLVLKEGRYCFYKQYIVHSRFFDDFDQVEYLFEEQAGKPRYIPEKEEFLKYADEYYEDNNHWQNVCSFMWNIFGYSKDVSDAYEEIKDYLIHSNGISELGKILNKYNLEFVSEQQVQEFFNLVMHAKNNTRIWENNGYTPLELHEIFIQRNKDIVNFPFMQRRKIGRNEPCPCGSGKKYKKCCAKFETTRTAQLSPDDCRLFYETWYGLLGYVNERKNVIRARIKPEYPNTVSDMIMYKVREKLWDNPEIIDDYINETDLPQEKIEILKSWRANHKKGKFIILEYQPEYAVFIGPDEQGEDRLYGVKGLSNPIANVVQQELPVMIETTLLPFKGKIIYDSFIAAMPVKFEQGAKKAFREMYDNAIKHGIIESLE